MRSFGWATFSEGFFLKFKSVWLKALIRIYEKISCRNQKNVGMGGWSYWQTKFTYKEWKYYWLTKCINKNHSVNGYVSHNHPYISSSETTIVLSGEDWGGWHPTASLLSLLRKKVQKVSCSYAQNETQMDQNFLTISGYFEHNAYRVAVLH